LKMGKRDIKIKLLPYEKLSVTRVNTLLKDLESNTIILIDAKLTSEEEAHLIEETMKKVSTKFKGIELDSLDPVKDTDLFAKMKSLLVELISGKKRGVTLIGPAGLVKQIKKDPQNLMLSLG